MINSKFNPDVDFYFSKEKKWKKEIEMMRLLILDFDLKEELKWGCPCYSLDGTNVVLIHVFKEYCAILFFKGALIADPAGILIQQTKNVQSARQIRFTSVSEFTEKEEVVRNCIKEAIRVEKAGMKVTLKKTEEYDIPEEFQAKLDSIPQLKVAFGALTPGRQRAYIFHFSQPKQSKTREARVEKYIPQILKGKGLDD
jgi:uncharacterized protein YdeI (YjbR/CyaY-like superfamily)